ncbi:MAG: ABC transporter permease [Thaumarchaeota archaeon]|nr:ABC transporter permease [Nitrososphaerota archaeon]
MDTSTSLRRRVSMAVQVFTSSIGFGRKGTVIWDSPEMIAMQVFLLPLFQISFFAVLAQYLDYSGSAVQYIVVGNALQAMSYSAVFAVANITSTDKWQGTLETLMVTPANRMALFVGRAVFQSGLSALIALGGLFYASELFGVSFAHADVVGVLLVVLVTSVTMMCFGLLISSVGLFLRTAMILANIFLFLTMLVSGVNFPLSTLPGWAQPVGYAIPMTYGTSAIRLAISGASLGGIGSLVADEVLVGAVAIMLGYLTMVGFERLARKTGRFEEY